jgi:hypothetical protein
MKERRPSPLLRALVLAFVSLVGLAQPASAHTVAGLRANDYRTTIVSVSPAVPGLQVKAIELGRRVQVRWSGPADLVIFGYDGEPYLRVGPGGVFENLLSHTTYANLTPPFRRPPPRDASPTAPPRWQKIADGRTVRWHDHQAHWALSRPPDPVRLHPEQTQVVIPAWTIQMQTAGRPIVVTGQVWWVPAPNALPWMGIALVLLLMVVASAFSRAWAPTLAAAAAILVGVDVFHSIGTGTFAAVSPLVIVGRILILSWFSVLAWLAGLWAARRLLRGRVDGLYGAALCAVVIGAFGGVTDLAVLDRSQVPFRWPAGTERAAVAVSLGLSVGILVAAWIGFLRHHFGRRPSRRSGGEESAPGSPGQADRRVNEPAFTRSTAQVEIGGEERG